MRIAYFTHSLASCWNHGNAHFLRGVLRELMALGHAVEAYEPEGAWSLENLIRDHGSSGMEAYRRAYPDLNSVIYPQVGSVVDRVADADVVVVHEWNAPELAAALGARRKGGARYTLLFHDTHHRAVSAPDEMRRFDLSGFDGVLAFGETLASVYRDWGWGQRVFVWHEAADIRLFHPPAVENVRAGLIWIGNWGDDERSEELETYLFAPANDAGLDLDIFGVRYPELAIRALERHGARYRGWAPNALAPSLFAQHLATIHVPRRFYVRHLPGIPTIRVFEALACGIPLACAPWDDTEGLFRPGTDYLVARDGAAMARHLTALRKDPDLRASLRANGLATIAARHTCAHRAAELLGIVAGLRAPGICIEPLERSA
ncbi:glycosyltransferase [Methylobacterium sp. Leaf117]|uniref:CgeB family protein n=1 Tax=Methylobacterium sp. Leaf117 TaxID=1736260 RepID=UPI0006F61192|nr:glycosyltransferase [Methylobacterium sp. Leaf117]KQP91872.1 glycosyltransferase [Methylobacterium sp. Leaf117]